jgi:ribosomal protein S18 acetylase RimI-like enzyme
MYTLRSATDEDYDFLYQLFITTMRSSITQVWGWEEARWAVFFREHFDASRYQIVVVDGQDVGALWVEQRPTEVYLDTIEIAPAWQGRGLGTAILRAVLADARARGLPVTLQVNRASPARRLYERLGFVETGRTATHYMMCASPGEPGTHPDSHDGTIDTEFR